MASGIIGGDLHNFSINVLPTFGLFVGLIRMSMVHIHVDVPCAKSYIKKACELGTVHHCCKGEFITLIPAATLTILALTQMPVRHTARLTHRGPCMYGIFVMKFMNEKNEKPFIFRFQR